MADGLKEQIGNGFQTFVDPEAHRIQPAGETANCTAEESPPCAGQIRFLKVRSAPDKAAGSRWMNNGS